MTVEVVIIVFLLIALVDVVVVIMVLMIIIITEVMVIRVMICTFWHQIHTPLPHYMIYTTSLSYVCMMRKCVKHDR